MRLRCAAEPLRISFLSMKRVIHFSWDALPKNMALLHVVLTCLLILSLRMGLLDAMNAMMMAGAIDFPFSFIEYSIAKYVESFVGNYVDALYNMILLVFGSAWYYFLGSLIRKFFTRAHR